MAERYTVSLYVAFGPFSAALAVFYRAKLCNTDAKVGVVPNPIQTCISFSQCVQGTRSAAPESSYSVSFPHSSQVTVAMSTRSVSWSHSPSTGLCKQVGVWFPTRNGEKPVGGFEPSA